jgi:tetratricopeptide (TPR) repeat protein
MEGAALYAQGNFEAARAKFHEAYVRSQNPNSMFNEARATLKGHHPLEAAKLLKAYLALPENDKITAADRKEAEALLEEAMAKLCTLDVRVTTCVVDGVKEQGSVLVEVGEHLVRMDGAQGERRKQVKCAARETVLVTYEDEVQKVVLPPPPPPPKEEGEKGSWVLPGVLAGVGVVGLGVGFGLGAGSISAEKDAGALKDSCALNVADACNGLRSADSKASSFATGAVIGQVVGAAALTGAVVAALVMRPWERRRAAHVSLVPTVGGASFVGSF